MIRAKTRTQTGFTIIELIVVIVVISILTAITVATYIGVRNKSYDSSIQADLKSIAAGMKSYKSATGTYPTSETQISTMQDSTGAVITAAIPKISHDGYDVTSPSAAGDSTSRNLLICVRSGGTNPQFGIAAYSRSGAVWFYLSSTGAITQSPDAWVGQQTTECPRVGVALADPGYARWFGYERTVSVTDTEAGWRGWAVK
jgi:prepilin-type N-terminal cleavage/methylation domain-containing protein